MIFFTKTLLTLSCADTPLFISNWLNLIRGPRINKEKLTFLKVGTVRLKHCLGCCHHDPRRYAIPVQCALHDDVIKWKQYARYWSFVIPSQRPVTRCFAVFFDLRLNKRLGEQSRGWWIETSSRSLWRHCSEQSCNISCFVVLVVFRWFPILPISFRVYFLCRMCHNVITPVPVKQNWKYPSVN